MISLNSDPHNVNRNSGVYQFVYFGSGVVGNVFWYFQFKGTDEIHPDDRNLFVTVFLVVCSTGATIYLFLLPMPWEDDKKKNNKEDWDTEEKGPVGPITMLKATMALLITPQYLLLFFLIFYDGLSVTFWAGVYGPSLSFSSGFEDTMDLDALAGLHGIVVHVGCMLGGGAMAVMGQLQLDVRRYLVVLAAFACSLTAYALILLNVPVDAPLGPTDADAWIDPGSIALALTASFLLGLATGLIETQALALLALVYADQASHAFALQKVIYHLSRGLGFAYAGYLNLYWQLGMLLVTGILGVTGFTKVDATHRRMEVAEKKMSEKQKC